MLRAIWNGAVIAEAPKTVRLEGNHYFPAESVNKEYLRASKTTTICPWKGLARYYHLVVNGEVNPDAAWYYSRPSPLARKIKDHVAFWNGVVVEGKPSRLTRRTRELPRASNPPPADSPPTALTPSTTARARSSASSGGSA
jgi:uncharacterized protein (DUF427 family)